MADWIFDGVTRIIKEPNVGSGNLTWNAERDIYSAWKRWVKDNAQFEPAFSVEGGTPIGNTGLSTGKTLILANDWKLMAGDWDHISFVTGNLFSDDAIDVSPNLNFSASLKTFGSVNAQGINIPSDIDISALATKVNQEIINNGVKKSSLLIPHNTNTID